MRLIDKSSLVVMFSSEAETPTMAATSASCVENEGSVSVSVIGVPAAASARLYWPGPFPAIATVGGDRLEPGAAALY